MLDDDDGDIANSVEALSTPGPCFPCDCSMVFASSALASNVAPARAPSDVDESAVSCDKDTVSPSFVVFELASLLLPAQMASTLVMRMLTAMVLLLALVLAFLSMASAMNASKQAPIHSMSHDSM